ncbi:hypothetical protein NW851_09135 [Synechococcus sp. H55.7]|uniref:hypothetical protein n=1 Tax=unclassified Synechococcus TaxID=2626047 RepID=UPI0039C29A59
MIKPILLLRFAYLMLLPQNAPWTKLGCPSSPACIVPKEGWPGQMAAVFSRVGPNKGHRCAAQLKIPWEEVNAAKGGMAMPEESEKPEKSYSWKGSANAGRVLTILAVVGGVVILLAGFLQ